MELKTTHIKDDTVRQDALVASLREIIHAADKHSRSVVKQIGLSSAHIVVLRGIRTLGEGTTRQLSRNVSLSQATVTVLLNKLEALDLIERKRSLKDRRIVHSKLTKAGKALLRKSPPPLPSHFLKSFEALTQTRQDEIIAAFFDVAQMMGPDDYSEASAPVANGSAF